MFQISNKSVTVSWLGPWKGAAFVTLFFVTLASFLFWLDFFRSYETELRILVQSRNPAASAAGENLAEIMKTLSFYDRVLSGNEELEATSRTLTPRERREEWREMTEVKMAAESEVLIISVRQESLEMSRLWAGETAQALLGVASLYYDIREEVDLRIIDGPLSWRVVHAPGAYVLASLGSGVFLTFLFFGLLRFLPEWYARFPKKIRNKAEFSLARDQEQERPSSQVGESVPLIDPKKFLPTRPRTLHFEEPEDRQMNFPSTVSGGPARASAPSNLPVAPGSFPEETETIFTQAESVPENLPFADSDFGILEGGSPAAEFFTPEDQLAGPKIPETAEPTVEEYKARLNELLRNGS